MTPFTLLEAKDSSPQVRRFHLLGALEADEVSSFLEQLRRASPRSGGRLELLCEQLTSVDSAGAAALVTLWRDGQAHGYEVALRDVSEEMIAILAVHPVISPPPTTQAEGALEALGGGLFEALEAGKALLYLASDVTVGLFLALMRPWKLPLESILEQGVLLGSKAMGIVGLILFLVGFVLAFQGAYQLQQFGASIYVASLTSISVVSEMGPLITAILVAGRSGSAIASEVATMRVNEEVDAMEVMGISFFESIALPRLLALVFLVPLLGLLADVFGILGGYTVGVSYLSLGTRPYLRETMSVLWFSDILKGMFKCAVFAWGIGVLGLFYGGRVHGGAQEVGKATTASVVSAIFFIIVADALFSLLFYVVL